MFREKETQNFNVSRKTYFIVFIENTREKLKPFVTKFSCASLRHIHPKQVSYCTTLLTQYFDNKEEGYGG